MLQHYLQHHVLTTTTLSYFLSLSFLSPSFRFVFNQYIPFSSSSLFLFSTFMSRLRFSTIARRPLYFQRSSRPSTRFKSARCVLRQRLNARIDEAHRLQKSLKKRISSLHRRIQCLNAHPPLPRCTGTAIGTKHRSSLSHRHQSTMGTTFSQRTT